MTEEWLEEIISDLRATISKDLREIPRIDLTVSGRIGEDAFKTRMSIETKDVIESIGVSFGLMERSLEGTKNLLNSIGAKVKLNRQIKGLSGTKYIVPISIQQDDRLILADYAWSNMLRLIGLPQWLIENKMFSFVLGDVFRLIDISNAQKVPAVSFISIPTDLEMVGAKYLLDLVKVQLGNEEFSLLQQLKEEKPRKKDLIDTGKILSAYFVPRISPRMTDIVYASTLNPRVNYHTLKGVAS